MQKAITAMVLMALMTLSVGVTAADIKAGKAKAGVCAGCHGNTGLSSVPMYPNLAGQHAQYLEKQLKAFRDGTRKDAVMAAIVGSLTDADIANLSAYFASLK